MKVAVLLILGCLPLISQQPATAEPIALKALKRIYIEKMDNDLDQYIRAEITKQFKGELLVVLDRNDADAIMIGVSDNQTGVTHRITGRYLGLHDNATGSVSITDRAGKVVLWSSEAGDRSLFLGVARRGGPRKVAGRHIRNLKRDMR